MDTFFKEDREKYDPEMFSHYYWYDSAKKLKFSAECINEKLRELREDQYYTTIINRQEYQINKLALFESYMMLLGFALENLIKAISIKKFLSQGNKIVDYNDLATKVWKSGNAHNISLIAKNCDFTLSDEEADLLKRHTEFVIWAGRYHIPKKKSQYNDAFENKKLSRNATDWMLVENLFDKAKVLIEEKNRF